MRAPRARFGGALLISGDLVFAGSVGGAYFSDQQLQSSLRRVLGGEGCEFCQMLAGRGAVYSAETADFEAHDKCACTPEPDWG